jgi:uncharacterized membrane protein YhaH (DUF805 family)
MNFLEAIRSGFRKYATFSGRAVRSEYWFWALFTAVGLAATALLDSAIFGYHPGPTPFKVLFEVATLLPSLAVAARRLHDTDRTAWWLLLFLTLIGAIALIVWYCEKGTPGPNRFGPDPLPPQ